MIRVLQLIPTLDRAGAEKQMVMLAEGLPRDRFEVEVAALTRLGPLVESLEAAGVPVTLIGKRHKLDPGAFVKLTRFLNTNRFDVVNTWLFAANVYGRIAVRRAKVPVVVTSEMAVDLWKSKTELRIDRWLAQSTDRIIGNSQAVVDFYRDHGIPESRLERIYSGIEDLQSPEGARAQVRRELEIDQCAFVFLFAGRLAEQKRVSDLLDALDLLQHVEPGVITLIAGDGPLKKNLLERAGAFNLVESKRVRFLGLRDDMPRLLDAADALVLPSQYEGLPNVVLEAMQFGKPVVATAAPGTTELVVDNETGILVPVGQPRELCRALRAIARDREHGLRLGEAGRTRVRNQFSARAMIDAYSALYERLFATHRDTLGRS